MEMTARRWLGAAGLGLIAIRGRAAAPPRRGRALRPGSTGIVLAVLHRLVRAHVAGPDPTPRGRGAVQPAGRRRQIPRVGSRGGSGDPSSEAQPSPRPTDRHRSKRRVRRSTGLTERATPADVVGGGAGGGATPVVVIILPDSVSRLDAYSIGTTPSPFFPSGAGRPNCTFFFINGDWSTGNVVSELASGLGTCAYFAAFGRPGDSVGRWFARRQYDAPVGFDWRANECPGGRASDLSDCGADRRISSSAAARHRSRNPRSAWPASRVTVRSAPERSSKRGRRRRK